MPRSSFSLKGALFRRQIKKKRIEAHLKQEEVAGRPGRPQSFVANYENGERRLDFIEFVEVAEAIGFGPAEFLVEYRSSVDKTLDPAFPRLDAPLRLLSLSALHAAGAGHRTPRSRAGPGPAAAGEAPVRNPARVVEIG